MSKNAIKHIVSFSDFLSSVFLIVLISFILFLSGGTNAYACPARSAPVDVTNIFDLAKSGGQFFSAIASCSECENEGFEEITFDIIENEKTYKSDAYLANSSYNYNGSFMKNFDPWHAWGAAPNSCGLAPVVQDGHMYDIFIKDGKIVWLDRHDPFMMTFFSNHQDEILIAPEYYKLVAGEIFRNASEYWMCEKSTPYSIYATNALFIKTDRKVSLSSLYEAPKCKSNQDTKGLTINGKTGHPIADWYFEDDKIFGYQIENRSEDAKVKTALVDHFRLRLSHPKK